MGKFLDDFLLTMPETQAEQLKSIYNKEASGAGAIDKATVQEALTRLKAQIDSSKDFSFQGRHQSNKLVSSTHNQNMEEIDFDLNVLFNLSASIDEYMKDHLALTQSGLQIIDKNIYKIKQRMTQIRMMLNKDVNYDQVIYETLEAPNYTEVNEKELLIYATDRFNEQVPSTNYAEQVGNALILAGVMSEDQVKTNYGRKLANIKVRSKTGYSTTITGHEIDKAFDNSMDTYWAENVLVDEPIEETETTGWEIYSKYGSLTGALCEIEIQLDAVSTVSDIHFDPFCSYPIEIVDITGYENRDFGGKKYSLISREHENPNQVGQTSNKKMIFRFPSVEIGSMIITIRQENYTKENYIVKKDDLENMEMWNQISSDQEILDDTKKQSETMAEFNRKNEISGWTTYLDALKKWATDVKETGLINAATTAMEKIRKGDYKNGLFLQLTELENSTETPPEDLQSEWNAVNKTSYVYGAYNISVYGRKYKDESVYVSKPFNLSSNAKRITLDTTETQVTQYDEKDGHKSYLTDIEYYLTAKKNPTFNEWIPICPISNKRINNELLLGDTIGGKYEEFKAYGTSIEFSLRFTAASKDSVEIHKNGQPLPKDYFMVSDDGRKVAILAKYYISTAAYTVSYQPTDKAYYFDTEEDLNLQPILYTNDKGEVGEHFKNIEAGSSITLQNTPYLSRNFLFAKDRNEESYKQKENVLKEVSIEYPVQIWVDDIPLLNITNYDSNTYDPERLLENNGYTFAQIGSEITFGKPVDKETFSVVKVDYHYIINNIRMKAILRRTTLDNDSVTPELLNYTIQCINKDQEV